MKKVGAFAGGAIIIAALVGGGIWWLVPKPAQTQAATGVRQIEQKDACTYLTQSVADAVLGSGAQKNVDNNNTSSDDIKVSTCTYTTVHDSTIDGVKNMRSVTLLVRAPLSTGGERANREPFDPPKAGTQSVNGYGEMAFWEPQVGQLNVYKNGAWLMLSAGLPKPDDRTLPEAKMFADKIIPAYN